MLIDGWFDVVGLLWINKIGLVWIDDMVWFDEIDLWWIDGLDFVLIGFVCFYLYYLEYSYLQIFSVHSQCF